MTTTKPKEETIPYVMRLPHGQSLFIEIPKELTDIDRSGELCFKPDGVRFLDRIRVLAIDRVESPSPGYIATLRDALRMTQTAFGKALGVDKMTVYRWEHGTMKPGKGSLEKLQKLVAARKKRGVRL